MQANIQSRPASAFSRSRQPIATTAVVPSHPRHRATPKKPRTSAPGEVIPPLPPPGIFEKLGQLAGPYGVPASEVIVGAWFALSQGSHALSVINPGPAQLVRAGGSAGAGWHILAALAGAAAAIHGVVSLVKLIKTRKKS